MMYKLMHKNDAVCDIEIYDNQIMKIGSIYNRKLLPVGVEQCDYESIWLSKFNKWNNSRSIPSDRQNINVYDKIFNEPLSDAKVKSMLVSLTDCY